MREITMAAAIREALREEMRKDNEIYLLGEDIGAYGGAMGVTGDLFKEFPERVLDTPISECGIMGIAIGGAYSGMKMVPEIMYADFLSVCFDYLLNQVSKNRYMTGMQEGGKDACMVLRTPTGTGLRAAAQHSQCMEQFLIPIPGLKIVAPSTPYDAKGLLKAALRGNDPVVFLEHKMLYYTPGPVPEEDYIIPLGQADVKREGTDVTVIASQQMVNRSLAAAETLAKEGIQIEVVDPRCFNPLDMDTILKSVHKTKRVVLVNEASGTGNAVNEIYVRIMDEAFSELKAAPVKVCGPDTPIPFAPQLEDMWTRDENDIIEGIRKALK